ncbi:MAG: hypothetical protein AB9879_10575 [Methanothrix sp.]
MNDANFTNMKSNAFPVRPFALTWWRLVGRCIRWPAPGAGYSLGGASDRPANPIERE